MKHILGRAKNAINKKNAGGGAGSGPTGGFTLNGAPRDKPFGTYLPAVITPKSAGPKTSQSARYTKKMGDRVGDGLGFSGTAKAVGSYGMNNLRKNVGGDWGDMAKWAGTTAAKGAFAGGAIGGTVEAAQGGSFWAGAKEGAFAGAIGGVAFRGAGKAFANDSMNPMKVAQGFGNSFGLVSATPKNMAIAAGKATQGQRASMSKSVQAIMRNQKDAGNVL